MKWQQKAAFRYLGCQFLGLCIFLHFFDFLGVTADGAVVSLSHRWTVKDKKKP